MNLTVAIRKTDDSRIDVIVLFSQLSSVLSILESSPDVMKFKVFGENGSMTQASCNLGDYQKWVQTLY
jgi:hypothetical protein